MENFGPHTRIGIAVCTPIPMKKVGNRFVHETVTVQWHRARMTLGAPTNINFIEFMIDGKEVGDARNLAVMKCLQHDPNPEFLFFLDYDVLLPFDAINKLFFWAREYPDYDIFSGLYCCKWQNKPDPLIYAGDGVGPFMNFTVGDILTTDNHGITSTHMGLTLIRTSLFKKMVDAKLDKDNILFKTVCEKTVNEYGMVLTRRGTEDIYFCNLAKKVGLKILVDTSVLAGHIDKNTGIVYGLSLQSKMVKNAQWLLPEKDKKKTKLKKALDIGAGGTKRVWEGYETKTTDIRPDVGADFVQNTLHLNFPNNYWDLTASSHHLEHIPRWKQEDVWKEIYRITKPGGLTEHIVPDISWASAVIVNGEMDKYAHAMNVFYGAQEAHGYGRENNLHYFGYEPAIAKELAEQAGFKEVEIINWKQDPKLGYNMIIRGKKPGLKKINKKK
jgi:SAM-dependent methyltransferase